MPSQSQPYLDALAALPFVRAAQLKERRVAGQSGRVRDGLLLLRTPTGQVRFVVEHKTMAAVRARDAVVIRHQQSAELPLMVFAPYIDPNAARFFAEHDVSYIDLHGNCRVAIGTQYLALIERAGAPAKPAPERGWRPASYRVLFALLAAPESVRDTTRALATRAGGGSPQTAADVLAKLERRGVLLKTGSQLSWAPGGYQQALELWTHGFSTTLLPALAIGRFRSKERQPAALEEALQPRLEQLGRWAWGGGAACHRLNGYYRGDRTVLYLEQALQAPPAQLGLVPDARGPIMLAKAPGPLAFYDETHHIAHPLLVYVDLLDEQDPRATEAARLLYDELVKPAPTNA